MSEEPKTVSIQLRVRRVTYEDAYIGVLVTNAIMTTTEDGGHKLNVDAFEAQALRIALDPRVQWQQEESKIEPHPIQMALPADRKSFDPYLVDGTIPE